MKGSLGLAAAVFASSVCVWRAAQLCGVKRLPSHKLTASSRMMLKWAAVRKKPCLVTRSKEPHTKIRRHTAILIKVSWNFGQVLSINYDFIGL